MHKNDSKDLNYVIFSIKESHFSPQYFYESFMNRTNFNFSLSDI